MAIIGGLGQIQLCFAALQQNIMPGPSEKPPQVQLIHFRWEPQKQIEKSENWDLILLSPGRLRLLNIFLVVLQKNYWLLK